MPSNRTSSSQRAPDDARLFLPPAPLSENAPLAPGLQPLGLGAKRDGLLYVPSGYDPARPARLVLMLHGAGGSAQSGIHLMSSLAEEAGTLLLAPDSRGRTWDVILGSYGPDVRFIQSALESVFARYCVDRAHLAVGGFSDGASYALSLGLSNGDVFGHVLAFSPGFMAPSAGHGAPDSPRVYISHGTHDSVLPIDPCSRRLVPQLQRAGYSVTYHEFDGPHTVPPEVAREALAWFLTG